MWGRGSGAEVGGDSRCWMKRKKGKEESTIDNEGMGCLMRKIMDDAPCLSTSRRRSEQADEREKDAPKSV